MTLGNAAHRGSGFDQIQNAEWPFRNDIHARVWNNSNCMRGIAKTWSGFLRHAESPSRKSKDVTFFKPGVEIAGRKHASTRRCARSTVATERHRPTGPWKFPSTKDPWFFKYKSACRQASDLHVLRRQVWRESPLLRDGNDKAVRWQNRNDESSTCVCRNCLEIGRRQQTFQP